MRQCLFCDEVMTKPVEKNLFFCSVNCMAKGTMSVSLLGRGATQTDKEQNRRRRRGTTSMTELAALWNVLRSLDEPAPASFLVDLMHSRFKSKRWLRMNSMNLHKKVNYLSKEYIEVDATKRPIRFSAKKDAPFHEVLSERVRAYVEREFLDNTSENRKS